MPRSQMLCEVLLQKFLLALSLFCLQERDTPNIFLNLLFPLPLCLWKIGTSSLCYLSTFPAPSWWTNCENGRQPIIIGQSSTRYSSHKMWRIARSLKSNSRALVPFCCPSFSTVSKGPSCSLTTISKRFVPVR